MSIYITRHMVQPVSENRGADASKGRFRRWLDAGIRKWQRRKMIATLEALDDRVLRDIGIYRGDIQRVVNAFDDRELAMVPLASATTPAVAKNELQMKAA